MAKESRALQRVSEIRRCRQAISDLTRSLKVYDEKGNWTGEYFNEPVEVPPEFLEQIGNWLDKALNTAQFTNDDFLPEGEYDHALRVSRGWNRDVPPVSRTSDSPSSVPKKGREGMR